MTNVQPDWCNIPASRYPFLKKLKRTNKRWKNEVIYYDEVNKAYYHKDPLHGEIEAYDKRGIHIGVLNPDGTPHKTKVAVKGRTIKDIL
ncbi:colicin E3/pyocin S6 family cytotoxin [Paenibacillus sp. UNC451MF]|uniref:colicin E3/pyocin S6 family cytotoxin n=1 Tax=Paenibacillus sp. UNC451MF TaxID=1449063 RepID=UPI00055F5303|nr:colicin E3/pyocin S6 family cytotoxin [Paenibacillus sp. UNC451MF]